MRRFQAWGEAGVEQRGLADARLAVVENDAGAAGGRHALVEIADLAAAAEKELGHVAGVVIECTLVGAVGQRPGGQRGQAKERVAGGEGQAPFDGRFGAGACAQQPRPVAAGRTAGRFRAGSLA